MQSQISVDKQKSEIKSRFLEYENISIQTLVKLLHNRPLCYHVEREMSEGDASYLLISLFFHLLSNLGWEPDVGHQTCHTADSALSHGLCVTPWMQDAWRKKDQ